MNMLISLRESEQLMLLRAAHVHESVGLGPSDALGCAGFGRDALGHAAFGESVVAP